MKRRLLFISMFIVIGIVAVVAYRWIDTKRENFGARRTEARFSTDQKWQDYNPDINKLKTASGGSRCSDAEELAAPKDVIDFFLDEPQCADEATAAIKRITPKDLGAVYLVRAERERPDFLLNAATATQSANDDTSRFNAALVAEKLALSSARAKWAEYLRHDANSDWAEDARRRMDRLPTSDGLTDWARDEARLHAALDRNDKKTIKEIVRRFPGGARRTLLRLVIHNELTKASLLAPSIDTANDHYSTDLVNAAINPRSQEAWERGKQLATIAKCDATTTIETARQAFAEAGSPLQFDMQDRLSACEVESPDSTLSVIRRIDANEARIARYPYLHARALMMRAFALLLLNKSPRAIDDYKAALKLYNDLGDNSAGARTLAEYGALQGALGDPQTGFKNALQAVRNLRDVWDPKDAHAILGTISDLTTQLKHNDVTLAYRLESLTSREAEWKRGLNDERSDSALNYAIALRAIAETELALNQPEAARRHLQRAQQIAADRRIPAKQRAAMRINLLRAEGAAAHLRKDWPAALAVYNEVLKLAANNSSTERAELLHERAETRRGAGDEKGGNEDDVEALRLIRLEEEELLSAQDLAAGEVMFSKYFARFGHIYRELAERHIEAGEYDEAFSYSEEARGFEPLSNLLASQHVPAAYRPIGVTTDFDTLQAALPEGAVVIHYMVMEKRTYAFVFSKDKSVPPVRLSRGREDIETWVRDLQSAAVKEDRLEFEGGLAAPFEQLVRAPLQQALAINPKPFPLVIVPDGPMLGLPFNALYDERDGGKYLIEYAPISVAPSVRLFVYAASRNAELRKSRPQVALFGNPATDTNFLETLRLTKLPRSKDEVETIQDDYYPNAVVKADDEATAEAFLQQAPKSDILHFAGHAVVDQNNSFLVFAGTDTLDAQTLLKRIPSLPHTRLVILSACSSAGGLARGLTIGPEGMAPLVRPFVAANVPGFVGTLWKVNDDTTRDLMVSLHCHYSHGDDVTAALRQAQLEMLQEKEAEKSSALRWGAFQVIGYASSPFPSAAKEKQIEYHSCQDPVHGPDGLRSQ